MPVFQLSDKLVFPCPDYAEKDGLLAVGGDLSEERLLLAYSWGIFPWYSEDYPILWWSPDPRLILIPGEMVVSRSLRQTLRKDFLAVTMDTCFEDVIRNCASVRRKDEKGTWISDEMIDAYINLHRSGLAHSVEIWREGELAGGLYGVSIGGVFFGESMFTKISDASKVAFVRLVYQLERWNFSLIDCQVTSPHLKSLGAREVSRKRFMWMLGKALQSPTRRGKWNFEKL